MQRKLIMDNRFPLGFFPTPLHELKRLSQLYSPFRLFIKRDDTTGLATGGNKTRKLEYLIRDALDKGYDAVITAGAQQSNHCRQTAAACAAAGLKCHLLLGGEKPLNFDGNLLLSSTLGAYIHFTSDHRKGEDIPRLSEDLKKQGLKPYIIPYGGSNIIGAKGFIEAVSELQDQLDYVNLQMDYIFFASSSGGMQAGMILGKLLHHFKPELIGINIDKDETNGKDLEQVIWELVQEGMKTFQIKKPFSRSEINLVKGYDKAGYGVITEQERKAIDLLARNEGILLDPVYTARAFYGMMDHIENKQLSKPANILFWHTGGIPANFYYRDHFKPETKKTYDIFETE